MTFTKNLWKKNHDASPEEGPHPAHGQNAKSGLNIEPLRSAFDNSAATDETARWSNRLRKRHSWVYRMATGKNMACKLQEGQWCSSEVRKKSDHINTDHHTTTQQVHAQIISSKQPKQKTRIPQRPTL